MSNLEMVATQERCEGASTAYLCGVFEEVARMHGPEEQEHLREVLPRYERMCHRVFQAGFHAGRKDVIQALKTELRLSERDKTLLGALLRLCGW